MLRLDPRWTQSMQTFVPATPITIESGAGVPIFNGAQQAPVRGGALAVESQCRHLGDLRNFGAS